MSTETRQEIPGEASLVKRALKAVDAMQAKLAAIENKRREPVAIVGMGCRFPGGADDGDKFWRLLDEGVDAIREVPRSRWDIDRYYTADESAPGKMYTRYGGFVDGLELFDAPFFRISPREARSLDPQQRLLLEVSWEALENAGIAAASLRGSATGVFMGLCSNDYAQLLAECGEVEIDAYLATGTTHSMAAGRLSYLLGLNGPNLAVDTACSSALAAVHLAIQSLRSGESDLALAGAVNCILTPGYSINFCKARMLARDGRCKAFDASADGFVRGEGAGVVVLKRLSDAMRDGDRILALLRGSAMNQDGHTSGPTVPSGPAQQAVIRKALENAGVKPDEVSYVEAHGTGTSLGDPIEAASLGAVFGAGRNNERPLLIGSVKTNIGHLEGAAGIAGLLKVALAMQHGRIPKSLHFAQPSPHIDWAALRLQVVAQHEQWPGPRIAGVSSFGFSGTNVHVVMEEAPVIERREPEAERDCHVLALSARSAAALHTLAARLRDRLPDHFPDVAFTANCGRSHFEHRLAVIARDGAEAMARLDEYLAGGSFAGMVEEGKECPVAFVFPDVPACADPRETELYRTQPVFRAVVDACGVDLAPVTVQLALAEMWMSWGVRPSAVFAEGMGCYAAWVVAGVCSREDALALARKRGVADERQPRVPLLRDRDALEQMERLTFGGSVPAWEALAAHVVALYMRGVEIDWAGWDRGFARRKLALPTYPFERRRHWVREEAATPQDHFVYEVEWQHCSLANVPRPLELVSGLKAVPANGTAELLGSIERLSANYVSAALARLGGDRSRVEPKRRRLFDRLTAVCEGNGTDAPAATLGSLLQEYPHAEAELNLVSRCGAKLTDVLLGLCDPVETLLPRGDDVLERIYRNSPSSKAANLLAREAMQRIVARWPEGRPLRVLEVGAGTGGTTVHLLDLLPADRTEYVFTDVSRAFLTNARERLCAPEFVHYKVFDVERDAGVQGFAAGAFDVVVAANVLHATADVRSALRNVRTLLAPDGTLMLLEVVEPRRWLDLTFGLLDGWWRFTDTDLRPGHPLLSPQTWQNVLAECAFDEAAAVETAGGSLLRQALIVGRANGAAGHITWFGALDADCSHDPHAAAADVCTKLLEFVQQALQEATHRPAKIWVPVRDPLGMHLAPLRGLCRVIGLEHPEIWGGLVHVPAGATMTDIHRLVADAAASGEKEIAFRGSGAEVPRLVRKTLPERTAAARLRADATYLITGGFGFLGLRLAKWMAAHGARHIALMGRSGAATAEAKEFVDRLKRSGVRVEEIRGDAASPEQMRRVLGHITGTMPPLRGVVHAAARGDTKPVLSLTRADILEEFGGKITGAWALHELTKDTLLDFFVLFSSASSVWGAKEQAHYAAANCFLDALAWHRKNSGLPALSVNWGLLSGGGMISAEYRDWLTRAGVEPLDPEDGFHAMFRLMDAGSAQAVIARVQWEKFTEIYEARGRSGLFERVEEAKRPMDPADTVAQPFREMTPGERRSALLDFVQEEFCRTLGLSAADAPPLKQGFFNAGMDSLLAIEFKNRLQQGAGVELSPTVAFNYPNAEALADYLNTLLEREAKPAMEPVAVGRVDAEPGTEEEIARLFAGVQTFLQEGGE